MNWLTSNWDLVVVTPICVGVIFLAYMVYLTYLPKEEN